MVGDNTKAYRKPLLPLRHGQGDFFVCDIFDAAPKGDMASMAHPIFSLSTKPDRRIRRYETADGNFIEIKPNVVGLATVHDRDVLIYCISQIMSALNDGQNISKVLRLKARDLLIATNRNTDGRGYEQLKSAFERLQTTSIETNITTGGTETIDMFSLIDRVRIVRETRDGRMLDVEVTLSDWVFNAIAGQEVLTLNRQYFQLRKPLERRLYELARKHCGQQKQWRIGLDKLQLKTGSNSSSKEFKRLVQNICKADKDHNHMPDYTFQIEHNMLHVSPKAAFLDSYTEPRKQNPITGAYIIPLSADALEKARDIAPTWDIDHLAREWRAYAAKLKTPPKNADAAFLGFCKSWYKKRGRA